jgi:hypothetical protein
MYVCMKLGSNIAQDEKRYQTLSQGAKIFLMNSREQHLIFFK